MLKLACHHNIRTFVLLIHITRVISSWPWNIFMDKHFMSFAHWKLWSRGHYKFLTDMICTWRRNILVSSEQARGLVIRSIDRERGSFEKVCLSIVRTGARRWVSISHAVFSFNCETSTFRTHDWFHFVSSWAWVSLTWNDIIDASNISSALRKWIWWSIFSIENFILAWTRSEELLCVWFRLFENHTSLISQNLLEIQLMGSRTWSTSLIIQPFSVTHHSFRPFP